MGEKYRYDGEHAQTVRRLAGRIFDQLKTEHSLGPRDRLLLDVAAILHDIGLFVGLRGITNTASTFSRPPRSSACHATT